MPISYLKIMPRDEIRSCKRSMLAITTYLKEKFLFVVQFVVQLSFLRMTLLPYHSQSLRQRQSGGISHLDQIRLGVLKNATVTSLSRADTTVVAPTSAQWIELDSSFGATSAGLAVITQNQTMTVARGCSIDCRWSVGQTFQRESRMLGIFEAHIGEAMKPDGNMYAPPEIASFFDEQNSRWYSDTIRADQAWLDTISPINTNTDVTGDKGVTLFEHLLKNGGLYFPITDKDPIGSFGYITVVEYAKPSPKVFQ